MYIHAYVHIATIDDYRLLQASVGLFGHPGLFQSLRLDPLIILHPERTPDHVKIVPKVINSLAVCPQGLFFSCFCSHV